MKLAVLMDALDTLKAHKDSTVAMIKRAREMGWQVVYFTPKDIYCRNGQVYAEVSAIDIGNVHQKNWAKTQVLGEQALLEYDIILMRKDPPFDMEYIYATYALDLLVSQGVLVANKPQSLRDANEKFFTLYFPQCCPETLVSRNIAQLSQFWQTHKKVIFKPLEGMGGKEVFYVDESGSNLSVILEVLTQHQHRTIMAQCYIPEIKTTGDKRILLINGEPVSYGMARIPASGELRGNLAAGATGKVIPITEKDRWIAQQIAPTLQTKGLYFVGIDVIGEYLTEINVTSPTCMCEIMEETGLDIAGDYLQFLKNKVDVNV